jgi:preprotein translocase subunit SecA
VAGTGAAAAAATGGGSAVLRGGPAAATPRALTESLGDQPISNGSSAAGGPKPGFTPSGARIGRNDPCWCGSGAKYKKCHGR